MYIYIYTYVYNIFWEWLRKYSISFSVYIGIHESLCAYIGLYQKPNYHKMSPATFQNQLFTTSCSNLLCAFQITHFQNNQIVLISTLIVLKCFWKMRISDMVQKDARRNVFQTLWIRSEYLLNLEKVDTIINYFVNWA